MERRKFLRWLGIGAVAGPAVVAAAAAKEPEPIVQDWSLSHPEHVRSPWDGTDGVEHKVRIEGFGLTVNFKDLPVEVQRKMLTMVYGTCISYKGGLYAGRDLY